MLVSWCHAFYTVAWPDFEGACRRFGLEADNDEVTEAMVDAGFTYSALDNILIVGG